MESATIKMRQVPEDRIKTLTHAVTISDELMRDHYEYEADRLLKEMGLELARKLAEHCKIKETKFFESTTTYTCSIDIIVPPTPEGNAWNPHRSR